MFRVSGVFRDLEQLDFVLAFQLVFYLVQKGIPYAAALRNTSDIVLYNPNPVLKLGRGGDDDDDKGKLVYLDLISGLVDRRLGLG
jgi:hypothetical protein